MKKRLLFFLVSALLVLSVIYAARERFHTIDGAIHESTRVAMGTVFTVKSFDPLPKEDFSRLAEAAYAELARLEADMSPYRPGSTVSMVATHAGTDAVAVSDDMIDVITRALDVSVTTGGVFDITFQPLGSLWDISHRTVPPDNASIETARTLVNYRKLHLDRKQKTLLLETPGMAIGLGGIAKGYAAGKMADILQQGGIENVIINAGGDLFCRGKKGTRNWTCGIKNPDAPSRLLARYRIITDCAVATSGNYERYFTHEGTRYHHIIDPRTGYPAHGMKSVTVFSRDPALADAYATAFFILGYKQALAITEHIPGIAFVMIDDNNQYLESRSLGAFAERLP